MNWEFTLSRLTHFKELAKPKTAKIMATMELGRRHKLAVVKHQNKVTSSASVFDLIQPLLGLFVMRNFGCCI